MGRTGARPRPWPLDALRHNDGSSLPATTGLADRRTLEEQIEHITGGAA
jgi:hypothetical protein